MYTGLVEVYTDLHNFVKVCRAEAAYLECRALVERHTDLHKWKVCRVELVPLFES